MLSPRVGICLLLAVTCLRMAAQPAQQPGPFGLQPPAGIPVPEKIKDKLLQDTAALGARVAELQTSTNPLAHQLWPDVAIFHKAVDWALRFNEFHSTNQFVQATELLRLGSERALQLRSGTAPWTNATGTIVRGFVSRVDDSVQPYAVVVPVSWNGATHPQRLDIWLAGRDEKRTELKFLWERLRSKGEFNPPETVVLHPYGRFCNAYKFAGETDVFESIQHAESAYGTDPRRRALRGFSMGGAGTWHLAAHHPLFWRSASPGAGFVDTANYTGILKSGPVPPPWEQTLWRLYDVPGYAANLRHLDVVAYSGELDKQKLAADTMAAAMHSEGLALRHVIGSDVEHKYEPAAKAEVARQVDEWMTTPTDPNPRRIEFKTFTTQYPSHGRMGWFQLVSLLKQWDPSHVRAELDDNSSVRIHVSNVRAFQLFRPEGFSSGPWKLDINGQSLVVEPKSKDSLPPSVTLELQGSKWKSVRSLPTRLKRPGSQGPIDDAFTSRFLVVRPTGKFWRPELAAWTEQSLEEFLKDWRGQFRGEPRVKRDSEVTETDIQECNLILWGDPSSNRCIADLMKDVPIGWGRRRIYAGKIEVPSAGHLVSFIYPNPRNPNRYVVVNSGHTFARWNGTNARQTPWLPDWAVRELTPSTTPRGIIAAGFFDEDWQMP